MPPPENLHPHGKRAGNKTLRCPTRIAAVRLGVKENGDSKIGDLSHIEAGTSLEVCGLGYNGKTVRVRVEGEFFYVFRQDIGLT